jgi:glycosyltransferase involved in cell wall biosynthesis
MTSREYSSPSFQKRFTEILLDAIARADRIIAVSNATRQDLLRHTKASDQRIRVVHHGVDSISPPSDEERQAFRQDVLRLDADEKFFLNVGVIQTRKNIANIVLATARLRDARLVLAGGDGFGAEATHQLIERNGLGSRVIRLGHASAATLRMLYSTAAALVFPSLEEGFGMPVLEAMACGLPVITSDCSAMPEVAGEAAILVNPRDVLEISEAMRRVAEDQTLAADLRRRGRERAAQFSWKRCAQETWKVYQEALNESG